MTQPGSTAERSGGKRYTVVVGLDESAASDIALSGALSLAAARGWSSLHVVWVVAGYDPMHRMQYAYDAHQLDLGAEEGKFKERLDRLQAEHLEEHPGERVELVPHVLAGPAAKEILRVARGLGADLIVVGTHGRGGVKRLVLGSVAEEVLRRAGCPVLAMRDKDWSGH